MPKSVHPRRDEAVAYALSNPTVPYNQVSRLYGVSESSLGVWISRVRKRDGLLAAPVRPGGKRPGNGHRAPPTPLAPVLPTNLVSLPKPVPPPEIQEEYRAAALAAAKRMRVIANDPKLTLKDAALILELTTGTYGTVAEMEGKKAGTTSTAPRKLVEALLGNAPAEEADEKLDAVLTRS